MPVIQFVENKKIQSLDVPHGANLMAVLLENGLPVASSCLGKGICSKCRIQILAGRENLNPESESIQALRERNHVPDTHRISCQTVVLGDIRIDASYW